MNSLGYTIIRYDQGKLIKFSEKVALKKLFENRNFETVTTQLNLRSGIDLFIEDPKRIQVLVLGGECRIGEKVFSKGDYYCHIHPDQLLNICSVSEEVNILVVSSTDLASCLQEIKNTNNDHQYYADFTALYALDVLSRQEKAGLERHMQSCRDCVREVEDFSAVVSDLGFALEARKPSSKVKESLLAKMSKASF
ncbi:MAG: hypothetical protein JNN15_12615, partial [Blastocatellia bacterium]|nr:hypothetical protein [Blastocatellia bacterium]